MTVLDSSAVLALLFGESGAELVGRALSGGTVGAANLAEVVGKVVDRGGNPAAIAKTLTANGVSVESVEPADAELAGAMRALPGGQALSLGDRLCLALAVRSIPPTVLTADRAWAELPLPIEVQLIR